MREDIREVPGRSTIISRLHGVSSRTQACNRSRWAWLALASNNGARELSCHPGGNTIVTQRDR